MCARLLACPLCSQPGFLTLDALRAGLVSVATRPLVCPVCNEVLLGIDKLTIHLFGHTINLVNSAEGSAKHVATSSEHLITVHNAHNVAPQDWNIMKTQQLDKMQSPNDGNNKICTERSGDIPIIGGKISIVSSQLQSQPRSQNPSGKSVSHHFTSDYNNYDVIKINILPQSSENHDVALGPGTSLQEMLKAHCSMQSFCNDNNNKHLNQMSQDNAQTEKTTVSDFCRNWTEKQGCGSLGAMKVTGTDNNVYKSIETEVLESSNSQYIVRERPVTSLMGKENLIDFQSIQSAMPIYTDRRGLPNAKESTLEANAEGRDESLKEQRTLAYTQTRTKIFQAIAPKEKTERCNICGFHFPDVNILTLHQQLVHEEDSNSITGKTLKSYSCHLCSKVFKMRGSLMVHMRVAHVGYNVGASSKDGQAELACEIGYNCPTCGKRFKKEQHVIQHLKTHEGKQWECDVCSKMFTTKYFLKKHKRLHSGEMPYKCKICNKNFTFQQSYHKHRLYHKDDKPHTCATCGRSFKELSTLHNHERIHTGEKPFACETCGKCFRQRVSYLVHRRIHTGVMPYKCTMCGKSFRYKVSQRTHKCPAQTSENTQQLPDRITQETADETVRLQAVNTMQPIQESQPIMNTINNEENKFVLIINAQGQHVLAMESEMNNVPSEEKTHIMEFGNANNINRDLNSNMWTTGDVNNTKEECTESTKKTQLDGEKINVKNTNGLFSLMSRLENSVSSTFEMEHLRVSSPKQKEDAISHYADFPQITDNAQMDIVESDVQNLTRDKDVSDSFQTINVESLKELLYSMDRK